MALTADLTLKLDSSGVQGSLVADLGDVSALLDAIDIPLDPAILEGAVGVADGIDLSNLEASAADVANALTATIGEIPQVGPLLTSITEVLELAARFADANLEAEITTLIDQLSLELDSREGGALGAFLRIGEILKRADQTRLIKDLYGVFVTAGGAPDIAAIRLPDLLPGLAATIRTLGALMSLEALLQDSERLSRAVASELDIDALRLRENALVAQLESLPLIVEATDVTDLDALEVTARAVAKSQIDLEAHIREVAEGMAFGEGTIIYIDFARLKADVQGLLGELRAEDLSVIERATADLAAKLGPLLAVDLSGAPRFTLDDLLSRIEAEVGVLAGRIETADLSAISQPLTDGLKQVTQVPADLASRIEQVNLSVASALAGVTNAIASVPIGRLGDALRTGANALGGALGELSDILGAIDTQVGEAAESLSSALADAEAAVDTFVSVLEALFQDAAAFVEGLDLDGVSGAVSDNIAAFADVMARADLAPYFSTASGAINTAAGVVEKVPFALLPDSMEQEVVNVARPIKQTDLDAFRREILAVLQIGDDGTFTLRPELEEALGEVQAKVDSLLAAIRDHDPGSLAAELAPPLDELRARIADISPQVDLAPVRNALDSVKATIGALDPASLLTPVNAAFDDVLAEIDRFSPASLLDDIEARMDEVREKIIDTIKLRAWREQLDSLETRIVELLAIFDLTSLEDDIASALEEVRRQIEENPRIRAFDGLGAVISSMLGGRGGRSSAHAFEAVADWLSGASARATLEAHTNAAMGHLTAARTAAQALDPMAIATRVTPALSRIDAAIELKADGAGKVRLEAAADVTDPMQALAGIGANRGRYLATLEQALGAAGGLRDLSLGQADAAAARLRGALTPFSGITGLLQSIGDIVGLPNALSGGLSGVLTDVLDAAPPERLAAMLNPVYQAIRGRLEDLLAAVLDPLRQAIDDLLAALEALNLDTLRAGLDGVQAEVRGKIEALRPDAILAEPLAAFADVQAAIQAFDPLGDVFDALEDVQTRALSVTGKLDPEALVATPQAIFDDILGAFEALEVEALVRPLLDQLDAIAGQVDTGLEETVTAFRRLQDALPDKIGSTSLSASASVSVG